MISILWLSKRFIRLASVAPGLSAYPKVSIIIPACNEEGSIREAVTSVLKQDYPDLQIILIDDRSTDATGLIMQELARENPGRLTVLQIERLPEGWLGKNHALWTGTKFATGTWLLFADADVVLDPTCIRRAITLAERDGIDHVAMFPHMVSRGFWLTAYVGYFISMFSSYNQLYMANTDNPRFGTGAGAFNLIRRTTYEAIGTHRAISLRPDDDVRMGMRVKLLGFRQRAVSGSGVARVEWYPSFWEAVMGLEKNTFAVADYSLLKLLGMTGLLVLLDTVPYLLVWFAQGPARWLLIGTIAVHTLTFIWTNAKAGRWMLPHALVYPLMSLAFLATMYRAAWLAYRQGGIKWRGTLYPLAALRGQTGLEGTSGRKYPF